MVEDDVDRLATLVSVRSAKIAELRAEMIKKGKDTQKVDSMVDALTKHMDLLSVRLNAISTPSSSSAAAAAGH